MPIGIPVPPWAFGVALRLCQERHRRFENRFRSQKLRDAVGDDPRLVPYIEGVFGYMGDICACQWLGIDAAVQLQRMMIDTGLLQGRDEQDLIWRGHRIDVKTEEVGRNVGAVVDRTITPDRPYGSRLINADQYRENHQTVDVYLFATFDRIDPRQVKTWFPVGAIESERVRTLCPVPGRELENGRCIPHPAYAIPTRELHPPEWLKQIAAGPHDAPAPLDQNNLDAALAAMPRHNGRDRVALRAEFDRLCERVFGPSEIGCP